MDQVSTSPDMDAAQAQVGVSVPLNTPITQAPVAVTNESDRSPYEEMGAIQAGVPKLKLQEELFLPNRAEQNTTTTVE